MGKYIGRLYKNNRPKLSPPTPKKPVLSSSAAHASSECNSAQTSISSKLDNKDITTNRNRNNTSNTDDIHLCVTPRKTNYSVQATSTTTSLTPLNPTLTISPLELHTTTKNTPVGKEYLCFQINGRSSHASQCVQSLMLNKAIYSILLIDTFE